MKKVSINKKQVLDDIIKNKIKFYLTDRHPIYNIIKITYRICRHHKGYCVYNCDVVYKESDKLTNTKNYYIKCDLVDNYIPYRLKKLKEIFKDENEN